MFCPYTWFGATPFGVRNDSCGFLFKNHLTKYSHKVSFRLRNNLQSCFSYKIYKLVCLLCPKGSVQEMPCPY